MSVKYLWKSLIIKDKGISWQVTFFNGMFWYIDTNYVNLRAPCSGTHESAESADPWVPVSFVVEAQYCMCIVREDIVIHIWHWVQTSLFPNYRCGQKSCFQPWCHLKPLFFFWSVTFFSFSFPQSLYNYQGVGNSWSEDRFDNLRMGQNENISSD